MTDRLKGLFGGGNGDDDKANVAKKLGVDPGNANDFVKRYMDGNPADGYSDDEAVSNFEKVARNASPEQMERATRQALTQMNPGERSDFAKMLEQRKAGQGFVPIQRAGEGGAAGTAAGSASGGDVGIDDILGGLTGGGGGGLGGILGGLLGGGGGGGTAQSGGGGGGLGGMLGDILGGGDDDDSSRTQTGAQAGGQGGGGNMLGGIGDLLGSPAGKALIGGIAAFGMKELLDNKK